MFQKTLHNVFVSQKNNSTSIKNILQLKRRKRLKINKKTTVTMWKWRKAHSNDRFNEANASILFDSITLCLFQVLISINIAFLQRAKTSVFPVHDSYKHHKQLRSRNRRQIQPTRHITLTFTTKNTIIIKRSVTTKPHTTII